MMEFSDPHINEAMNHFEDILMDPDMDARGALEVMKVAAIYRLADSILAATKEITSELSGNGLDIRIYKEEE